MGRWIRRGLVILAALVAGVMLVALLVAHSPWARSRALTFARDFVTRYNLVLEAGSLGYNAVTRRITLTDVRLAAKGHEQRPFLVASRIEVQLPWTRVSPALRDRSPRDHRGIVDIYRDENDIVNLPPGSDRPTPEQPRRLDIRGLTLNGLDVQYTDAARNWAVKVPRIESELLNTALGAKGNFAVRGELMFRLRDRIMTMSPFETVMTFDGSNVMLEEARLASTEIDAFIAGPIKRVLDSPTLDLTLKGSVNLDKAIKWVPPPPVPVSGMATIEGTITGPARDITTDLKVSSNTLSVGRERAPRSRRADPRHVRIVLGTRSAHHAEVGRTDSREVQGAVGTRRGQHRRRGMERPRLARRIAARRRRSAGRLAPRSTDRARSRSASRGDSPSSIAPPGARALAWCR